ncbi:MAG: glycosyltransferase family 4 protein [bacterium]
MPAEKKNILIVTSLFYPEIAANSKRMTQVAEDLVANGYSVDVITAFPYYQEKVDRTDYKKKIFEKKNYQFSEIYEPIKIIRSYAFFPKRKTFFKRVWTFLSFAISSVIASFKLKEKDYLVVLTISPPFFSCFSVYLISKILRCPYILDIQDIYPETLEVLGIIKSKVIIKFLEFLEIFLYKRAKKIIVISSGFKKTLVDRGISRDKVEVIENWADPDVFVNSEEMRKKLSQKYSFNGKFIVMFVGTIGICQGLENSIKALEMLKEIEDIHFVFLGDGVSKNFLVNYVSNNNLKNATFIERQPHNLIPDFMSLGDVYLSHIRNNRLYSVTIPCKTYEYLAMGKPILMAVTGEGKELVERLKSGIGVEPENPNNLADAVKEIYYNKELYKSLMNNGREYIINYANRKNMTQKFNDIMKTIDTEN